VCFDSRTVLACYALEPAREQLAGTRRPSLASSPLIISIALTALDLTVDGPAGSEACAGVRLPEGTGTYLGPSSAQPSRPWVPGAARIARTRHGHPFDV